MRKSIYISVLISCALTAILIYINYITTPGYWWAVSTTYILIMFSLSMHYRKSKNLFLYSLMTSIMTIIFLGFINFIHTPDYPWILYTLYPLIFLPILIYFIKYLNSEKFAILIILLAILYYILLNIVILPSCYPWFIFIIFPLLWWPMSLFFCKRKMWFGFSLGGSINVIVFFMLINYINTPFNIWFVYPTFAVLWWPLSMYFFHYKYRKI